MLAEKLLVLNGEDTLWPVVRPLLDAALCLEQSDDVSGWHGWRKSQVKAFLAALPSPCSLVVGVWDTLPASDELPARDALVLGAFCKVEAGQVCALGTFETLVAAGLKSMAELEIGMEDALEIMHYTRRQVAPVAWALFIEKAAWDEWLFATANNGGALDKGALLADLALQGRCVLMGSQAASYEKQ